MPVEVRLATDHADVGSLEQVVTDALAVVGQALWVELIGRLEAALERPVECAAVHPRGRGGIAPGGAVASR